MRRYAWYCIEQNSIVFQCIADDCYIVFEWPYDVLSKITNEYGTITDPMHLFTFQPLGEL